MKRMNFMLMILAITLFAVMAIADPGPVTDTVLPDFEMGFAHAEVEVEVAPAPTLFDGDLAYGSASIAFAFYIEKPDYALLHSTNIDCGDIAKAKYPARMRNGVKRVLERHSPGCF